MNNLSETVVNKEVIPETIHNLKLQEAMKWVNSTAVNHGLELYLTGGIAVAALTGEHRPLSLDLDFVIEENNKPKVAEVFHGQFQVFKSKPLFKSEKLVGKKDDVDLDFIAEQNIVPDAERLDLKLVVRLNEKNIADSVQSEFMGVPVKVFSPATILISKLFAGRGLDLNKYDLTDSYNLLKSPLITTDVVMKNLRDLCEVQSTTMGHETANIEEREEFARKRLLMALEKVTIMAMETKDQLILKKVEGLLMRLQDRGLVAQIHDKIVKAGQL